MKRPMLGHRKLKVPPLQLPGTTVNLRLPAKTQRTEHLFQIRPLYALQEGILAGSKQPHFTGRQTEAKPRQRLCPRSQEQSQNMSAAPELVLLPVRGERTQGPHGWVRKATCRVLPKAHIHVQWVPILLRACMNTQRLEPRARSQRGPSPAVLSGGSAHTTPHGTSGIF